MSQPTIVKSEDEWRAVLSPEQFRVIRKKGTESPGTGKYEKFKGKGRFVEFLFLPNRPRK